MKRFNIVLKGETPLLMHNDNIPWQDELKRWYADPANKGKSTKGDDRTPAWVWVGYLYKEYGKVVIPADNLMSVLKNGGAMCPTGKGNKTFKGQSQSGIMIDQSAWPLLVNGKELPFKPFEDLIGVEDFSLHERTAVEHGFELFVKRAKVGDGKHVRVRPRFDNWAAMGTVTVFDDGITPEIHRLIWEYAGMYAGLCDWRPKSPRSPGMFGRFSVEITER